MDSHLHHDVFCSIASLAAAITMYLHTIVKYTEGAHITISTGRAALAQNDSADINESTGERVRAHQ